MINIFRIGRRNAGRNRGRERYVARPSGSADCEPTLGGARWDYNAWPVIRSGCP